MDLRSRNNVTVSGAADGPVMLFAHGFGCDQNMWRLVAPDFTKVREYATGARDQFAAEVGDDFDDLREPLQDLARLRNGDARRALAQQLLDASGGCDSREDLRDIAALPVGSALPRPAAVATGTRPPFDPDAT